MILRTEKEEGIPDHEDPASKDWFSTKLSSSKEHADDDH